MSSFFLTSDQHRDPNYTSILFDLQVIKEKYMFIRGFRIFQTSRYQGIVKATVSGVFGDLKF